MGMTQKQTSNSTAYLK